jgi:hypothetical protein
MIENKQTEELTMTNDERSEKREQLMLAIQKCENKLVTMKKATPEERAAVVAEMYRMDDELKAL